MNKKGYLHIAEYDLTKKILDSLEIDIGEDEYELYEDEYKQLMYKDKELIFPPYDKCLTINSQGIIFRPFTNVSHANYLMNMFAEAKCLQPIFEYSDNEEKTLNGTLKITKKHETRKVTFNGIKNIAVLQTTLILKEMLDYQIFKKCIGQIFKIDKKLSGNK